MGAIALASTTFYVSTEFMFTGHIRGEATRINMAGQMRYRSFETGWLLHRMVESKRPELRETVMDKIKAFEGVAGALRSGSDAMGVRAVKDKDEAAALDGIVGRWNDGIKQMVLDILERPDERSKPTLERYDSLINGFVTEIDGFVNVLEGHFKREIRRFNVFRVYTLGMFVIVSLFIVFYIRKVIIKPIGILKGAAEEMGKGNLGTRIALKGDDDIGLLADTMNEMAIGLEGAVVNLEGMVQQRTEEAVAAYEEMVAASEELQAAYSQLAATSGNLEKANEELKSLDRLKTEFLQTISHELRSPITPVLGYLEMMKDGDIGELTEKQREVVEEMHICGKNMQLLVDELVEVASIQAGRVSLEMEDTELGSILWHAVKDVRKYLEERQIELEVEIPSGDFRLTGDRERLAGIFTHLMRNAVKFSSEKGKVKVEVKIKKEGFEVSVSDMGVGIPEDKLGKIFDGFYQADSSATRYFEGVGLGLYLVKRLVELHNGHIRVESEAGKGTTFTVFIPKGLSSGL